jgi:hypothetical protein
MAPDSALTGTSVRDGRGDTVVYSHDDHTRDGEWWPMCSQEPERATQTLGRREA